MTTEWIIITCILIVLLGVMLLSAFLFIKNRKLNKDKLTIELKHKSEKYDFLISQYEDKILSIDGRDYDIIKDEVFKIIKNRNKQEVKSLRQELIEESNIIAADILIDAMNRIPGPYIKENTISSIKIEDDQMKGKIIGKNGRNKKVFETLTGVDLVIDKETPFINLSCHNPLRREIATIVLTELIASKVIEPAKIETIFEAKTISFEKNLYDTGKEVIENMLNIYDLPNELYPYIGRMKYRSSYGQNSLEHSIECARMADLISTELMIDRDMAVKCAFLHDIGKSNDYEVNESHIDSGLKIANRLGLHPNIINAIASHHDNVISDNLYSEITKIVDTCSAARPGARIDSLNEYFERVNTLEKIVNEFDQVNSCFAIKSGRQLRVIVNPAKTLDNDLEILAMKIKDKIEQNEITAGFNIKVVLIKENKYEFETKSTR
ncbi:MAG: HDIG domain-containing metalloprotein [Mycoplasma sp.]